MVNKKDLESFEVTTEGPDILLLSIIALFGLEIPGNIKPFHHQTMKFTYTVMLFSLEVGFYGTLEAS